VSGELGPVIELAGDNAGRIRAFLEILTALPRNPPWVLVGGFAVNIRIQRLHRLTNDIDTISANQTQFVELLLADPTSDRISPGKIWFGAEPRVEVDVMSSTEGDPLPESPSDRAFALVRRQAMATAEDVKVKLIDSTATTTSTARIPVATPASLLMLKAVALPRRSSGSYPEKVGSDTHDLVALVLDGDIPDLVRQIAAADSELARWVGDILVRRFTPEADLRYSVARMRAYAQGVGVGVVGPDELALLGEVGAGVVARLNSAKGANGDG